MSGAEEAVVALKTCPFCGGKCDPQGWRGVNRSGPECEGCGSTAETVAVWNRRADSVRELRESNARLREDITRKHRALIAAKPFLQNFAGDSADNERVYLLLCAALADFRKGEAP